MQLPATMKAPVFALKFALFPALAPALIKAACQPAKPRRGAQ